MEQRNEKSPAPASADGTAACVQKLEAALQQNRAEQARARALLNTLSLDESKLKNALLALGAKVTVDVEIKSRSEALRDYLIGHPEEVVTTKAVRKDPARFGIATRCGDLQLNWLYSAPTARKFFAIEEGVIKLRPGVISEGWSPEGVELMRSLLSIKLKDIARQVEAAPTQADVVKLLTTVREMADDPVSSVAADPRRVITHTSVMPRQLQQLTREHLRDWVIKNPLVPPSFWKEKFPDASASTIQLVGKAINRKLGLNRVIDLSATPFFLRGSGYAEGTLFPWTMSDFSLMDAIECGIVKLPRVPVAENIPGDELPVFRNLWENIKTSMPKKGRGQGEELDPLKLPTRLQTALQALYGHYEITFKLWQEKGIQVPPCFIIVCQNTAISKLVYDFVSGFHRKNSDGATTLENGRLSLFRNFDATTGHPLARPNTLLIDSEQLEAGDALDDNFRTMAGDEIERFRREIVERTGDARAADKITDQELLREVMNTVGKPGQLGGGIRCVVSVSMLTEGWDANTVTHVLGIRAFGTQLLCEQVIGRALRRQSYDLNEEGLFNVEYADVFGIPFDFTAKPVVAPPQPPRETVQVKAMRPERDHLEIRFPRVEGYRVELPEERLTANFNEDSVLELTPDLVGPSITRNAGIIGEGVDMSLKHLGNMRTTTLVFHLTHRLLYTKWRDPGEEPKLHLFGQLKSITRQWLETCLVCKGDTCPALLMYQELADMACNRITAGITRKFLGQRPIKAMLDPYNPTGSTKHVRFNTSRKDRWETSPNHCHINWVVLDSDWEAEFCRVAESHPKVRAYVKNHNLGFEVPYRYGSETRRYLPDFVVLVDDGHGPDDPLHLVVEIKGYRREDAKEKKATMETYWVPGVNHLGTYGRWAFAELTEIYQIEADFQAKVKSEFSKLIENATQL